MEKDYFVHETAIVDDNVTIGKNTKIWCFSHILKNTKIGERCNIGQNCVIGNTYALSTFQNRYETL